MKEKITTEISEAGEVPLFLLIPMFKESMNRDQIKYPIMDNIENYDLNSTGFLKLLMTVLELILFKGYGLFYYQTSEIATRWDDDFHLVANSEVEKILLDRKSWIPGKKKVHYFISMKE
jgi:hypothetical protein